jgi:hypothetical protein
MSWQEDRKLQFKTPYSGQNFELDVPMALELHSKLFRNALDSMLPAPTLAIID